MTFPDDQLDSMAHQIGRRTRRDGGNVLTSDELTQAARIGIWDGIETYDPRHGVPWQTWVRFRGYGAARDAVRAESRRTGPTVQIRERHSTGMMRLPNVDLKRAVSDLGDPDKTVVVMLFQEGLTIREVGIRFEVSHTTAKNWRDRAIGKLRVALGAG